MVLPEPVGALPQTSRPARPSGTVAAWTGKGSVMPSSSRRGAQVGGHAEGGEGGGHGWLSGRTEPRAPGWRSQATARHGPPAAAGAGALYRESDRSPPLGSAAMEPVMARKMWRTLEPYHGLIYFAPEATAAYEALGVMGFDGYFASRAAPMGAVPAEVVIATFFNFNPAIVHHAIPAAWKATTPEALLAARLDAAAQALAAGRRATSSTTCPCRVPPSWPAPPPTAAPPAGRPLYAGPRRAAVAGRSGARAVARHHAAARVPRRRPHRVPGRGRASTGSTRWCSTPRPARCPARRSRDRASGTTRRGTRRSPASARAGFVDADGAFTEAGAALRQQIEDRTDALALPPWEAPRGGGLRRAP